MKITRDTPEQFIIDFLPWRVIWVLVVSVSIFAVPGAFLVMGGAFGIGMVFILIGIGFPWIFGFQVFERSQLLLHRPTNKAEIRRRSFSGYTRLPLVLSDIESISTPAKDSQQRGFLVIRIASGMDASERKLNSVVAKWSRLDRVATRANAWLSEGRP